MKSSIYLIIAFLLFGSISFSACQKVKHAVLPVYDEVLVFDHAIDFTYLRVLDSILDEPDWTLHETNQKEGFLVAVNERFPDAFAPIDQRMVSFQLTQVSRGQTTVQVTPSTQTVVGVKDLLQAIQIHVNS